VKAVVAIVVDVVVGVVASVVVLVQVFMIDTVELLKRLWLF